MKYFFTFFLIFLFRIANGQITNTKIVNDQSGQPVSRATISNSSGSFITCSNDDGYFTIPESSDTAQFSVSCIGYKTYRSPYISLKKDSIIQLAPVAYSLPALFVGDVNNLVKAAYEKADSLNGKYFYGKGFDLQLLYIDNKPAECYEYLQNVKISVEGLVAREVYGARHGIIPQKDDTTSMIGTLRSFAGQLNWYNKSVHLKKLFKQYTFTVENLQDWDSAEIAKIHFTSTDNTDRNQEDGYYYIDTRSHDVLRYERNIIINRISIPFLVKFYNFQIHIIQNYFREAPFCPLVNSSLFMHVTATNPSGSKKETIDYSDKFYNTRLIPWRDSISFIPTNFHIKNEKLYQEYKNKNWINLPVPLSKSEKVFLEEMKRDNAFQ